MYSSSNILVLTRPMFETSLEMGALIARISMGRRIMKGLAFGYTVDLRSFKLVGELLSPGHRWHSVQQQNQKGPMAALCPWRIQSLGDGAVLARVKGGTYVLVCCLSQNTQLPRLSFPTVRLQPPSLQVVDVLYPIRLSSIPSSALPPPTTLPSLSIDHNHV